MPPPSAFDLPYSFSEAVELLRRRGIKLRKHPGYYSVNLPNGDAASAYQTEDFADAFAHGMAMEVAPAPPPLGPIGKGITRRALMYRHNRKLAAKRWRNAAKKTAAATDRPRCKPATIRLDLTGEIDAALKPWRCPQCRAVYQPPSRFISALLMGRSAALHVLRHPELNKDFLNEALPCTGGATPVWASTLRP